MKKIILVAFFSIAVIRFNISAQLIYTLPVEYSDYQLIFCKISINGESVIALFDTGNFSELRISSTFIRKYGLSLRPSETISKGIKTKNGAVMKGKTDSLSIGGLVLKDKEFDCIEGYIENISKKVKKNFDAVIGWPFLENYFFELDISKKYFCFSKKSFWHESESGFIPVSNINNVPVLKGLIQGQVSNILFDCGAPFSKIDSSFAAQITGHTDTLELFRNHSIPMKAFAINLNNLNYRINFNVSDIKNTKCQAVIGNNFINRYRVRYNPLSKSVKFDSL
ncbi:MAG: retroviral-like aspartic protease family protein [Chitinophagales bacterium]|nr:retroviral-like aspartic protease family protein [Chitinophagales bacterium]